MNIVCQPILAAVPIPANTVGIVMIKPPILTHLYFRILKWKFDCLIAVGVKKLGLDHIALLGPRSRGNLSWAEGRENF